MKTIKKRKKLGCFISFGLLLIVGWSAFIIMTPKKQEEPHGQAQSVQHTDQESGYIASNSSKEAVKSSESIVKDTGEARTIKLNSKEGGEKFTDLSSGSFKIYKANNVEVLKMATSVDAPAFTLQEIMQKYPEALIMNASGFNMSTMHITGFQMNNGKLFKIMENFLRIGVQIRELTMPLLSIATAVVKSMTLLYPPQQSLKMVGK